ncbi:MAG TPA: hypothetical protein VFH27_01935 [Longimicrobiaceae bacterium]|nr:hypothetical protein [Longimicrobiaceae bacterium]
MSIPVPPIDSPGRPAALTADPRTCACCGQSVPSAGAVAIDPTDPLAEGRSADGIFQRLPDPEDEPAEEVRPPVFHPVALSKVLVLFLSTLGLYQVFWAYRNWARLREHTGQGLSPFWRSLFSGLWGFVLFREVRDDAVSRGVGVSWRGGWLGLLYLALGLGWRLDGPVMLIAFAAILPILIVQHTINEAARSAGIEPDGVYRGVHVPLIAVGPAIMALVVYGAFLPD